MNLVSRLCLLIACPLSCLAIQPGELVAGETVWTQSLASQSIKPDETVEAIEQAFVAAIEKAAPSMVAIGRLKKDDSAKFPDYPVGLGFCLREAGKIIVHYDSLGDIDVYDYFVWLTDESRSIGTIQHIEHRPIRKPMAAKLIAADPWLNIACLQVDSTVLKPLEYSPLHPIKKGKILLTIGGAQVLQKTGSPSAGWGMVSNHNLPAPSLIDRDENEESRPTRNHYGTLMQIDARINFDTHGGALLDRHGRLVGMLTAYVASPLVADPAGFAIPADEAFRFSVESLVQGKQPRYGLFGVQPRNLSRNKLDQGLKGVQVVDVIPNTPAALAGIRFGDLIEQIDHHRIVDARQLTRILSGMAAGSVVKVQLSRPQKSGPHQSVELQIKLSKKFVAFQKSGFPKHAYPAWQGVYFEEASAVRNLTEKSRRIDPNGCVAIIKVDEKSAGWKAGLREGLYVTHANDQRVNSPEQLLQLLQNARGKVSLKLAGESSETIELQAVK